MWRLASFPRLTLPLLPTKNHKKKGTGRARHDGRGRRLQVLDLNVPQEGEGMWT